MPRALAKTAYWVCIGLVAAALCGCAETTYPSLPGLPSSNDSLLSPEQQQKTIKDLSSEKSQTGEEKGSSGR
jgi:hypothetical protein